MTSHVAVPVRPIQASPGRALRRLVLRYARDVHFQLALSLVVPVLAMQVLTGLDDARLVAGVSIAFLAIQAASRRVRARGHAAAVGLLRLGLGLSYVTLVSRLGPGEGGTPPLLALYIPIVVAAATLGGREAIVIGGAALLGYIVAIAGNPDTGPLAGERAIAVGAITVVLSIGTRRTVSSLERALVTLRAARGADRRRGRQLAAMEEVGSILAHAGPTVETLTGVMDVLVERFGYSFVSIYLGDRRLMRLGAQRGYEDPIYEFEPNLGVLGRVMRTGEPALVPDVSLDPDYKAAKDNVQSLLSVPLVVAGDLVGVVNVETAPPRRLDKSDLETLRLVGDRLASALALARERERLARRVGVFERMTTFAQTLTASLEPHALYDRIPALVSAVIPCDAVSLSIRDEATGEYRVVALPGGDERLVGSSIKVGDGMTGQAILKRQLVVDEHHGRGPHSRHVRGARMPDVLSVAAVPLIRDEDVIGAIAVLRYEPDKPFDDLDREILPLIGSQAALAITNAQLHHAATEASIRDPLTGLYNRRHLDASLQRVAASRRRQGPDERRPLSIIMFDLDHFGMFNKRYGHVVGDEVLRAFATILRERLRASDLPARFGGEEFVAVLDGATREEAIRVAEEVRTTLAATVIDGPHGEHVGATVSAGCAGLDREAVSLDGLLEKADMALAKAKQGGRNRVVPA